MQQEEFIRVIKQKYPYHLKNATIMSKISINNSCIEMYQMPGNKA